MKNQACLLPEHHLSTYVADSVRWVPMLPPHHRWGNRGTEWFSSGTSPRINKDGLSGRALTPSCVGCRLRPP